MYLFSNSLVVLRLNIPQRHSGLQLICLSEVTVESTVYEHCAVIQGVIHPNSCPSGLPDENGLRRSARLIKCLPEKTALALKKGWRRGQRKVRHEAVPHVGHPAGHGET